MAEAVFGNPPCRYGCPLNTDVPAFTAHVARGEYLKAFDIIRGNNPLPITCGYICRHPCEEHCRTSENAEPIAIRALERFVGDYALTHGFNALPQTQTPVLEKVAIAGSGPAGLSAAFDLARLGYEPTVFETNPIAGGSLTMTIPEFRLPRRVTELEVECIKHAGVSVLTNTTVGTNLTFNDLFAQGFKAILLAVGARESMKLGLPGEDTRGVMPALSFLESIRGRKSLSLGDWVAVIGGDDIAIDAARSARRLGAKEVSIVFQRTGAEMPADSGAIQAAQEEEVKIVEKVAPIRFIARNGRLVAMECRTMEPGECNKQGQKGLVPVSGSEFVFPVDNAIVAAGEQPGLSFLPNGHELSITGQNTIAVEPETFATAMPNVFATGDVVMGHAIIADTILSGKLAALSIHKFLRGKQEHPQKFPFSRVVSPRTIEQALERRRFVIPRAPVAERVSGFGIVELGYNEHSAVMEASRCLACDGFKTR